MEEAGGINSPISFLPLSFSFWYFPVAEYNYKPEAKEA
jgi:hypothetical protein